MITGSKLIHSQSLTTGKKIMLKNQFNSPQCVKITKKKCICPKLQNVFVQNCKMNLFKIENIFDTIARSSSKGLLGGNPANVGL